MDDDRVAVKRIRFEACETDIVEVLAEYHKSIAEKFLSYLSSRNIRTDFTPETYVNGELTKDVTYLRTAESRSPLVVALDGDRVVGCVYLYDLSNGNGEIKRLYVSTEYRGLGLGRRLMETLVEHAANDGYSTLRLDTAPFMDSARQLYEKLGFEAYDDGESISDVPGPLVDDLTYMTLDVSDSR